MRLTRIILSLLTVFLFVACHKTKPEEQALQAATQYYTLLAEGRCSEFLDAHCQTQDSIGEAFYDELLAAVEQYRRQIADTHGGIFAVMPLRATADSSLNGVNAFLLLQFNDNSEEEIVVPMVEYNEEWKIR